jgi:hypothetical protein
MPEKSDTTKSPATLTPATSALAAVEQQEAILRRNIGGYCRVNGRLLQITGVYGRCFTVHEVDANGNLIDGQMTISARLILGTIEAHPLC